MTFLLLCGELDVLLEVVRQKGEADEERSARGETTC